MFRPSLFPYGSLFRLVNVALLAVVAAALVTAGPARAKDVTILAFGDSLTAGLGLNRADAFPARLEAALLADGIAAHVVNAGVSGDTTAGGRARLSWTLAGGPVDAVILELGANDGLRGLDPATTKANLAAMLSVLKARHIPVLLTGMLAPPNFGKDYERAFAAIYPALAHEFQVALYPFFLDGVAADPALNQADGIHPTPKGVAIIVRRILPYVKKLIAGR